MYEEMCEARKRFKSKLKWCLNNHEQIKMDVIAQLRSTNDFAGFWRATNKLNGCPSYPDNVNGINDPEQIANAFMSHFKTVPPMVLPSAHGLAFEMQTESIEKPEYFITAKEVGDYIRNMTKGKSPGHDGLSIEHLQAAGVHLPRVLSMLYNICIRHSYLPSDMMKTVVVPIAKNRTGDVSDIANYRPISLATIIAKVLDGLLDLQLRKHLKLHDLQFGFRQGVSTESAILCLKHTVKYYTDRSTPIYACFLDLSKAFDTVSYELLWRKLETTTLPKDVIWLLRYWYGNQINHVRWNDSLSDEYRLECGVRQGGLTSPNLFSLYVNGYIPILCYSHIGLPGVRIFAVASG